MALGYLVISIILLIISMFFTHTGLSAILSIFQGIFESFNIQWSINNFIEIGDSEREGFIYIFSFLQAFYVSRMISHFAEEESIVDTILIMIGNAIFGTFLTLVYKTFPYNHLKKIWILFGLAYVVGMVFSIIVAIRDGYILWYILAFTAALISTTCLVSQENIIAKVICWIISIIFLLYLLLANPISAGVFLPILTLFIPMVLVYYLQKYIGRTMGVFFTIIVILISYPLCTFVEKIIYGIFDSFAESYSFIIDCIFNIASILVIVVWVYVNTADPDTSFIELPIISNTSNYYNQRMLDHGSLDDEGFWEFYKDGSLYISNVTEVGFNYPQQSPWEKYTLDIDNVYFEDGISKINRYALSNCPNLKSIRIPDTTNYISHEAFINCPELEMIEISEGNDDYYYKDGAIFSSPDDDLVFCPKSHTDLYNITQKVHSGKEWYKDLINNNKLLIELQSQDEGNYNDNGGKIDKSDYTDCIEYSCDYGYYTLYDINNDGKYELFLSKSEKQWISDKVICFTEYNDQIIPLNIFCSGAGGYLLAKNGTISIYNRTSGSKSYEIYALENGQLIELCRLDRCKVFTINEITGVYETTYIYSIDNKACMEKEYNYYINKYVDDAKELTYKDCDSNI